MIIKYQFFLFLMFITINIHSKDLGYIQIKKNITWNDKTILLLDNTENEIGVLELYSVTPRVQTWNEWWYNIEPLQPEDSFITDFSKWKEGSFVSIKNHNWDSVSNDGFKKYNNDNIAACNYIIKHIALKKEAFATPLNDPQKFFSEFVEILKKEKKKAYDNGYNKGYFNKRY